MAIERQKQQRVGNIMPEGTQLTGREAIPSSVSDILRGASIVPGGSGRAAYLTEGGTNGQKDRGEPV